MSSYVKVKILSQADTDWAYFPDLYINMEGKVGMCNLQNSSLAECRGGLCNMVLTIFFCWIKTSLALGQLPHATTEYDKHK